MTRSSVRRRRRSPGRLPRWSVSSSFKRFPWLTYSQFKTSSLRRTSLRGPRYFSAFVPHSDTTLSQPPNHSPLPLLSPRLSTDRAAAPCEDASTSEKDGVVAERAAILPREDPQHKPFVLSSPHLQVLGLHDLFTLGFQAGYYCALARFRNGLLPVSQSDEQSEPSSPSLTLVPPDSPTSPAGPTRCSPPREPPTASPCVKTEEKGIEVRTSLGLQPGPASATVGQSDIAVACPPPNYVDDARLQGGLVADKRRPKNGPAEVRDPLPSAPFADKTESREHRTGQALHTLAGGNDATESQRPWNCGRSEEAHPSDGRSSSSKRLRDEGIGGVGAGGIDRGRDYIADPSEREFKRRHQDLTDEKNASVEQLALNGRPSRLLQSPSVTESSPFCRSEKIHLEGRSLQAPPYAPPPSHLQIRGINSLPNKPIGCDDAKNTARRSAHTRGTEARRLVVEEGGMNEMSPFYNPIPRALDTKVRYSARASVGAMAAAWEGRSKGPEARPAIAGGSSKEKAESSRKDARSTDGPSTSAHRLDSGRPKDSRATNSAQRADESKMKENQRPKAGPSDRPSAQPSETSTVDDDGQPKAVTGKRKHGPSHRTRRSNKRRKFLNDPEYKYRCPDTECQKEYRTFTDNGLFTHMYVHAFHKKRTQSALTLFSPLDCTLIGLGSKETSSRRFCRGRMVPLNLSSLGRSWIRLLSLTEASQNL